MKYWNKDKRIRQEHWFKVQRVPGTQPYSAIKRQLQLMDSPGRFYLYYGSNTVWFERKEDAVWFSLAFDQK